MPSNISFNIKVCGDNQAGKSNIIRRGCGNHLIPTSIPTKVSDTITTEIKKQNGENTTVKLNVAEATTQSDKKSAIDGLVLVVDLTKANSLDYATQWLANAQNQHTPVVIALNKCDDSSSKRQITMQQVSDLQAKHPSVLIIKTSAKTGEGLQSPKNIFEIFSNLLYKRSELTPEGGAHVVSVSHPQYRALVETVQQVYSVIKKDDILYPLATQLAKLKSEYCSCSFFHLHPSRKMDKYDFLTVIYEKIDSTIDENMTQAAIREIVRSTYSANYKGFSHVFDGIISKRTLTLISEITGWTQQEVKENCLSVEQDSPRSNYSYSN